MLREEKGWCVGSLHTYTHSHTTQRRPHYTSTLTGSHKHVPNRVAGPPKGPMLSFPTPALQVALHPCCILGVLPSLWGFQSTN